MDKCDHIFYDISSRIKELQVLLGLTNIEMAERIDVGNSTYRNYLNKNRTLTPEMLAKIGAALSADMNYIMYGEDPKHKFVTDSKRLKSDNIENSFYNYILLEFETLDVEEKIVCLNRLFKAITESIIKDCEEG